MTKITNQVQIKKKVCPFCKQVVEVEVDFEFRLKTDWHYSGIGCNLCGAETYESCELIRDPDEPGIFFY